MIGLVDGHGRNHALRISVSLWVGNNCLHRSVLMNRKSLPLKKEEMSDDELFFLCFMEVAGRSLSQESQEELRIVAKNLSYSEFKWEALK